MIDISVIVCTYNHQKWIERCIRSLQNQTGIKNDSFEIILVDDASKDKTKYILKKFKDYKNIVLINNSKNMGLTKSLNIALKKSTGRYLVRVDSDDYVLQKFFIFYEVFSRQK